MQLLSHTVATLILNASRYCYYHPRPQTTPFSCCTGLTTKVQKIGADAVQAKAIQAKYRLVETELHKTVHLVFRRTSGVPPMKRDCSLPSTAGATEATRRLCFKASRARGCKSPASLRRGPGGQRTALVFLHRGSAARVGPFLEDSPPTIARLPFFVEPPRGPRCNHHWSFC